MYVDRKHQFSISWPKDPDWIPSSRMSAYQLSQLGWTASDKFRVFGLFNIEFRASFGVFKIQRPQGACVGWVNIDSWKKTPGIPNVSILAGLVATTTLKNAIASGSEIISQNVWTRDGRWSETPNPEIIYRERTADPVIIRIILGNHHVYSVVSPIYPTPSAYDNLRQDTNAILNSFTLLK